MRIKTSWTIKKDDGTEVEMKFREDKFPALYKLVEQQEKIEKSFLQMKEEIAAMAEALDLLRKIKEECLVRYEGCDKNDKDAVESFNDCIKQLDEVIAKKEDELKKMNELEEEWLRDFEFLKECDGL